MNREAERKRLVEVLEKSEGAIYWDSSNKNFIKKIADHLLDNGIGTKTPVKVGQTEYEIETKKSEKYCDHCGKVLDTMIDYDDIIIDLSRSNWTTADLCAECLGKLFELVCDFCERKGGEG